MMACMGQMVGTEECWELTGRLQQRQEGDGGGDLPDDGADLILDGLDGLIPGSSGRDTTSQSTDQQCGQSPHSCRRIIRHAADVQHVHASPVHTAEPTF